MILTVRIPLVLALSVSTSCRDQTPGPVAVASSPEIRDADEIAVACLYVDRCLERLDGESDLLGDRAASIVQSAERTLPVFWGTNPKALSPEVRAKIDGYPAKVRAWMDRINEAKAEVDLKVIRELDAEAAEWREANKALKWQAWIDRTDGVVESIQRRVVAMPAGPSLEQALVLLREDQRRANEYRRRQLTEYQKDAIRRCYQFLDYTLKNTIVSDDTLNEKFAEAEIFKVDSNLLGSDARRIYDAAVARMDGLRDRRRAEFFLKLSETPKWSLADY